MTLNYTQLPCVKSRIPLRKRRVGADRIEGEEPEPSRDGEDDGAVASNVRSRRQQTLSSPAGKAARDPLPTLTAN